MRERERERERESVCERERERERERNGQKNSVSKKLSLNKNLYGSTAKGERLKNNGFIIPFKNLI